MSLTDEQKAIRRGGIGGSEAPVVAGLSNWSSPLDVWRSKVEGWEPEETLPMRRGRLLEPAIAAWYAEETGSTLREVGTLRHKERRLALATPDRLVVPKHGPERLLEVKTANLYASHDWGEPGTDDIPTPYLAQVVWTLGVAGLKEADVAVLLAGDDFRIYRVPYSAELDALLYEAASRFWRDFVEAKRPPPPDASDAYRAFLGERYPAQRAPLRAATAEEAGLLSRLRKAEKAADAANGELETLRNQLRAAIGEAEGLEGEGFRATWRRTKDSERTDWQALAKALGPSPELIAKHTETRPGGRRLLVKFDSKEDES